MSAGYIILLVLIFLIMFGAGQRVLDRMRMNDAWALFIMVAIAIGVAIPAISIGKHFEFSIGGFLIPFLVCVYLLIKAGWSWDLFRAFLGTILTAGIIIGLEYALPASPEKVLVDYMYLYGIVAGLTAYLLGRSRRNAFICSVLGISLARVIQYIINISTGIKDSVLALGSAGAFDSMVIAILFAVGLCELLGESLERIMGEKTKQNYNYVDGEFVPKSKNINNKNAIYSNDEQLRMSAIDNVKTDGNLVSLNKESKNINTNGNQVKRSKK